MKALLTAFAVLSFVAASSLPMVASAAEPTADHTTNKTNMTAPAKHTMATKPAKTHKRVVHKRVKHHRHTAKRHTPKHTDKMPPKAG